MRPVRNCRSALQTAVLLAALATSASAQPFTFTLVVPDLPALEYGSITFADLDGDGVLDLLGTGNSSNNPPYVPTAYLAWTGSEFRRGSGTLWRAFDVRPLARGIWLSQVAWLDADGDGVLDFVATGAAGSLVGTTDEPLEGTAMLYRGNGTAFVEAESGIAGVYSGMVAPGDYDNDGDEDLLVAGVAAAGTHLTRLYRNENGSFVPDDVALPQIAFGVAKWVDYDNDGDLDLTLSGAEDTGRFRTVLYRNNGFGDLADSGVQLPGLAFSSLDWGDFDNDGDPDLVLSGSKVGTHQPLVPVTEVYRNSGGGFTRLETEIRPVFYGSVSWGDADSDGDLDLLVVGARDVANNRSGRVYRNEGGRLQAWLHLPGLSASSVQWGDYDGDDDLDLVMAGSSRSVRPLIRLYRNDSQGVNTPPGPPNGLRAAVSGRSVVLSWEAAADEETPGAGLSYNIRVGTAPGLTDVVFAASNPETGRRRLATRGNAGQGRQWRLNGLAGGTYHWSVQAIDHSLKASAFADEGSFSVSASHGLHTAVESDAVPEFSLEAVYPNPFSRSASVAFTIPEPGPVTIEVFNVLGSRVRLLLDETRPAGRHTVQWSADDARGKRVGAGLYFVRLRAGDRTRVRRAVLAR